MTVIHMLNYVEWYEAPDGAESKKWDKRQTRLSFQTICGKTAVSSGHKKIDRYRTKEFDGNSDLDHEKLVHDRRSSIAVQGLFALYMVSALIGWMSCISSLLRTKYECCWS